MGYRLVGWGIASCVVCEAVELQRKERENMVRRRWGGRIVVDFK
jgi:hypothetical protein